MVPRSKPVTVYDVSALPVSSTKAERLVPGIAAFESILYPVMVESSGSFHVSVMVVFAKVAWRFWGRSGGCSVDPTVILVGPEDID